MEQSTISVEKKTLEKLRAISQKSNITQCDIITAFIESLWKLITESAQQTEKISLSTWKMDLATSTMKIGFAPLLSFDQLPPFVQQFYRTEKALEDIELSGRKPTVEELVKLGFPKEDVEKLMNEKYPEKKAEELKPVYRWKCEKCGYFAWSETKPENCPKCGSKFILSDPNLPEETQAERMKRVFNDEDPKIYTEEKAEGKQEPQPKGESA